MPDYDKGTASWDICQVLTRHAVDCAKVLCLRRTAKQKMPADERADQADLVPCSCGRGVLETEQSRIHHPLDVIQRRASARARATES